MPVGVADFACVEGKTDIRFKPGHVRPASLRLGPYFFITDLEIDMSVQAARDSESNSSQVLPGEMVIDFFNADLVAGNTAAGTWLSADVNGDGFAELVQASPSGSLTLTVLGQPSPPNPSSRVANLTPDPSTDQGAGFAAWLVGDVVGNNSDQVIQIWPHGSSSPLGINVFSWSKAESKMTTLSSQSNFNQDQGGSWFIGDVNGDGHDELVQIFNNGNLASNTYGWDADLEPQPGLVNLAPQSNLGEGFYSPQVVLLGDINGDGTAELVQLWNNGPSVEVAVYGWKGKPTGFAMLGPATPLLSQQFYNNGNWLIGDINHDGRDEIVEAYSDGGYVKFVVYGLVNGALVALSDKAPDAKQGFSTGGAPWLLGDLKGDGHLVVIQPFTSGHHLAFNVYQWDESALEMKVICSGPVDSRMGLWRGTTMAVGNVLIANTDEVWQPWAADEGLGLTSYAYSQIGEEP